MDILLAIGHIAGAILVNSVIGFGLLAFSAWETSRNQRKGLAEISIELGIPVDQLEEREHIPQVVAWSAKKFSNDLLRNRISDICGVIGTGWNWLGLSLQVITFLVVIWNTVADDLANAVFAWIANAIAIIFILINVVFSLACRLLTGRWPGQAKSARAFLADQINNQRLLDSYAESEDASARWV